MVTMCLLGWYTFIRETFQTISNPKVTKLKDNCNSIDYLDEDVQDNVFESVLEQCYLMFRLLNGSFKENSSNVAEFKTKLNLFYSEVGALLIFERK